MRGLRFGQEFGHEPEGNRHIRQTSVAETPPIGGSHKQVDQHAPVLTNALQRQNDGQKGRRQRGGAAARALRLTTGAAPAGQQPGFGDNASNAESGRPILGTPFGDWFKSRQRLRSATRQGSGVRQARKTGYVGARKRRQDQGFWVAGASAPLAGTDQAARPRSHTPPGRLPRSRIHATGITGGSLAGAKTCWESARRHRIGNSATWEACCSRSMRQA